jgi:hypothetical protein
MPKLSILSQYLKDYTRDINIHIALILFSAALPATTIKKLGVPLCTRYLKREQSIHYLLPKFMYLIFI